MLKKNLQHNVLYLNQDHGVCCCESLTFLYNIYCSSHILLILAICDHNLHRNTYFLVFLHNEIVIRTCNFHLMLPLCVYA